jgi:endonuclease/exonuclease/phosphatase family metal-dependent hydrolase
MLSIISLNAWGGRLHAPLMDFLATIDADILCLQEVTRTTGATSPWLVYRDTGIALAQRADLFGEIAALLPGHDGFFMPASRGELTDGDRVVLSEFGLATFVRKSLPLIGQAQGFVHGAFSADGWGEHPRARNAHVVRLYSYADKLTVTIAQMHGLRDPAGKHDTPERVAQAEALVKLIGQVRPVGERLVVCGDFNVLPESVTFERLAALGLADLVTGGGHQDTRTSWYEKRGRFADYLLVSPEIRIAAFDVIAAPEVSDHRPLRLVFA